MSEEKNRHQCRMHKYHCSACSRDFLISEAVAAIAIKCPLCPQPTSIDQYLEKETVGLREEVDDLKDKIKYMSKDIDEILALLNP